jgi:tetratricopeptide (TPR) repeat protein
LGKALYACKEYDRAIEAFERSVGTLPAQHPERASLFEQIKVLIGQCFYDKGNHAMALNLYGSVLRDNENHNDALLGYAIAILDKGRLTVRQSQTQHNELVRDGEWFSTKKHLFRKPLEYCCVSWCARQMISE